MLSYPEINPIAFSIGPLKVHWYGLMYLGGFLAAYFLAIFRAKRYGLAWTTEQIADLIFYAAFGVVLGGRIGYMLFYNSQALLHEPWLLFKIWEGGMSFHGGLLGVIIALWFFSGHIKKPFFELADFVAPLVPIGLFLGRIGNFINGELWGRVTTEPWAMVFPDAGDLPRHPSQLYEASLEGLLLFVLVWFYAAKPRPLGRVSGLFLIGYALCRLFAECFREPDLHLGFIALGWLTMGQLLTLPMLFFGLFLWFRSRA